MSKKKCNYCGNLYLKKNLKVHMMRIHDVIFVKQHKEDPETRLLPSIQSMSFTCDRCQRIFDSVRLLREHKLEAFCTVSRTKSKMKSDPRKVRLENEESAWLCLYCPFTSQSYKGIKKHIRVHTRIRKGFVCYWCGIVFLKLDNLLCHKQKHLGPRQHPKIHRCSLCSFATDHLHKYNIHQTKHSGEKIYSCPSDGCEYKSSYSNDIRRHALKHKSSKPTHSCDQCEYGSHYSSDVIKHIKRVHSEERPHRCPHGDCSYSAAVRSSLNSHLARVHTPRVREPLYCSHCSFSTTFKCSLIRHIRSHWISKKKRCRRKLPCAICSSETPVSA